MAELSTLLLIAWPPQILAFGPLVDLGAISYGVYLWHLPVLHVMAPLTPMERAALGPTVAIGLAAVSRRFVERPFLRRRAPALEV